MRVFVAGASGAIGRPLVARLVARGHQVVGMTRSPEAARSLVEMGVEAALADAFDAEAVHRAVSQAAPDVVVEQLTSLPKTNTRESMRATAALHNGLRREGGANVQAAAEAAGARRYVAQSVGFWAAPGPTLADEETPFAFEGPPAVAGGSRTLALLERRVLDASGLEGIVLRYGFFYGPGTWYGRDGSVADQVRERRHPLVGDGRGVWSFVHVEDAAEVTVRAVERGRPGVYVVVDDHPSEMERWLPEYANWLGAPPPLRVSDEEALRSRGPEFVYYATRLRGASNAKARRELGFRPRPLEWLSAAVPSPQQPA